MIGPGSDKKHNRLQSHQPHNPTFAACQYYKQAGHQGCESTEGHGPNGLPQSTYAVGSIHCADEASDGNI